MQLFLTGASGFIGGSLAHSLKARGHAIRGLVRDRAKAERLAALGIEPVLGDLEDRALLTAEARRADAVITRPAVTTRRPSRRSWRGCVALAGRCSTPVVPA
ncbi:NAD(P)H-binding protein [Myxococcus xanthus]|uniref:NAD(P)H-binding protein n=1 Tax=Myxococcus xanthus TaxID=34 RepID=UPI0021F15BDF|nr:NAD(P)H-binding protein [Myxococcus xanthus]